MDLCDFNLRTLINFKRKLLEKAYDAIGDYNEIDLVDYSISYTIFRELVECLNYLHEQQPPIMHRDIKPANILLTIEPRSGRFVRLGDFGLAKKHECSDISHSHNVGTPRYMAREVMQSGQYNTSVDVYSLGEVAYMLFDKIVRPSDKLTEMNKLIDTMIDTIANKRPKCGDILAMIDKLAIQALVSQSLLTWLSLANSSRQLFDNPNYIKDSTNVIDFLKSFISHKFTTIK
ncbi:serine/threonine-protein kinase nekl-2-like [Oppia nitens]|uniref:serine/threonine-protein kinase nekl-2-like n=1 Tax=Oppia nitens TaxID=1686743 RepID=UPI0023DA7676|nr:serine/threonine-protein kinase nekl-2-like [Oppia nitens]